MTVDSALKGAGEKMDKAISVLKDELAGVRTGRATPALLQRVVVDYYGTPVPIQQLASFSVPEPRTLMISPFDRSRSQFRHDRSTKSLIRDSNPPSSSSNVSNR